MDEERRRRERKGDRLVGLIVGVCSGFGVCESVGDGCSLRVTSDSGSCQANRKGAFSKVPTSSLESRIGFNVNLK